MTQGVTQGNGDMDQVVETYRKLGMSYDGLQIRVRQFDSGRGLHK